MKNSRFSFVGKIDANSLESKVPFYKVIKKEEDKSKKQKKVDGYGLNLVVIAADNNRAFVEMAGFKNDTLKTYDSDGNELNIDWDERNEYADKIANYKKNTITLNSERYEFVSEYDFIEFVIKHIDEIKGKRFTVTGQIKKNVYKGKISDRFMIQNLFEVKEDEEKKNQLRVISEFYFNSESIDTADWKKEKKLRINGYTKDYINKENPSVYVPRQIVFNCTKVDFENEMHVKRVKYKLAQLNLDYEDGKIVSNLKKNKYYSIIAILSFKQGAEEIEFSEKELTDNQRMAIDLGLKTLEDFRPKGSIFGERVVEYNLIDYDLRDDYADGCIVLDESATEFEDNIYVIPVTNESYENFAEAINKPVESDDDDLFD